jgi:hypothetical protein
MTPPPFPRPRFEYLLLTQHLNILDFQSFARLIKCGLVVNIKSLEEPGFSLATIRVISFKGDLLMLMEQTEMTNESLLPSYFKIHLS